MIELRVRVRGRVRLKATIVISGRRAALKVGTWRLQFIYENWKLKSPIYIIKLKVETWKSKTSIETLKFNLKTWNDSCKVEFNFQTYVPCLTELALIDSFLKCVTKNFIRDETWRNCAKIKRIITLKPLKHLADFCHYFPSLEM